MSYPNTEAMIADYEYLGCHKANIGRGKVPEGYAIMVDADDMYTFWTHVSGAESAIHWNKWAVLRGAKLHAKAGSNDPER